MTIVWTMENGKLRCDTECAPGSRCVDCGDPRSPITKQQAAKLKDPADRWRCGRCRRAQLRFDFMEAKVEGSGAE